MREPVQKSMCATCPFRLGSPHANLADMLAKKALTQHSRICHSTGVSAIYGRTGRKPRICRGTRDVQLKYFVTIGFLKEPTDEAWDRKCEEMGIK